MPQDKLPHIVLPDPPEEEKFTSPKSGGGELNIPTRSRQPQAQLIKRKLTQAWEESESEFVATHSERHGVYLEFKEKPGFDLVTKSLEDMRSKKIRLCNIRTVQEIVHNEETGEDEELPVVYATVYVANEKKRHFFNKIEKYAHEETKSGKPKNAALINSISDLRKALLIDSFWSDDDKSLIPADEPEWCEVWLSSDSGEVIQRFKNILVTQEISFKPDIIKFPERAVMLVHVNRTQLENLTRLSDDIAEYRKAKETAAFWTELTPREQAKWTDDLLERLRINRESQVFVCLLDTGVNYGHPLLEKILDSDDCKSVDSDWGYHDHDGHGTLMAGIAGHGNLIAKLNGNHFIEQNHMLESVKILHEDYPTKPELWGCYTAMGISRAEIQAPDRKRIICMAVNATDTRDRGRPTSWSGELDQLASDAEGNNLARRLIIVSAGNITDFNTAANYPDAQRTDSIHDPAQSWNALTVGAYTELDSITDPTLRGYTPLAKKNELSPFTTTSSIWENNKWPIKPEIVMEGGNMAVDSTGFTTECADLSLLSTYYKPQERLLESFNMTSAATAQASWFAAQIQSQYPDYWPETVRALMVHSAEWTEELKSQFLRNDSKAELSRLLRICGYGVPDLEKALFSASNSLTLISEATIQPYVCEINSRGAKERKTKDMHLYDLPWPRDVLLGLPSNTEVQMRITLSYFIEPGPGEIGWKDRYRYASHALRFDIKSPTETQNQFIKRVNKAARDEDEGHPGTSSASDYWVFGSLARDKGSIHSDIWQGTAADLAASNIIAIYPVVGWWRERHHLGMYEKQTRYSLIVSITTPEEDIDIYTPVAQQVGIAVPIAIR